MEIGILWIMRSGAPWRDVPEVFGKWGTVWDLFDKWNTAGTLDEILQRLSAARVDMGDINSELGCAESTIVPPLKVKRLRQRNVLKP